MQGVLVAVADIMVATRVTVGDLGVVLDAGPTFEYYKLPKTGKQKHLVKLCGDATVHFPELGGDNSVRWLLGKLTDV